MGQGARMSDVQEVVIGLIWHQGRLLVGLRPEGKSCPSLWEFPGGKCEPGETHAEALARECREELGIAVRVGSLASRGAHREGSARALQLFFYHCTPCDRAPRPEPHATQALAWLWPKELTERPFCPGDRALIARLAAGDLGPPPFM